MVRGSNSSPTNTPAGNLGEVYDQISPGGDSPINSNIHGTIVSGGTDFISSNVHGGPVPTDEEGPINENIYD